MLLERLPAVLEATSAMAKQAPAEYRSDLVAFEQEAAMATTASAMSQTALTVMKNNAAAAELAISLAIADQRGTFRLELHGERGGQAAGIFGRAELQRILQMIRDEAARAHWLSAPGQPPISSDAETTAAKPMRH